MHILTLRLETATEGCGQLAFRRSIARAKRATLFRSGFPKRVD